MTKAALKDQVGRNVLSYVDDIIVVSKKRENYITNLAETFTNMREARLKLNPEKCVFGITKGKSLVVSSQPKALKQTPTKSRSSFRCNLCRAGKTYRSSQIG
jgi:hypothetical protein